MRTIIYYFTGTGNSLWVVRELAKTLGDADLVPIARLRQQSKVVADAETIGLVFPLYYFGLPAIVREFATTLVLERSNYVFAVTTRASPGTGGALQQLKKLLRGNGKSLDAGFYLNMPNNYFVRSDIDPEKKQKERFGDASKKLQAISALIQAKKTKFDPEPLKFLTPFFYNSWSKRVHEQDYHFNVDGNCNGCGICAKVCPVDNIELRDKQPQWLHRCQECWGCINFCPKHAIQYDRKTVAKGRYHHPEVTVKDMMNQK